MLPRSLWSPLTQCFVVLEVFALLQYPAEPSFRVYRKQFLLRHASRHVLHILRHINNAYYWVIFDAQTAHRISSHSTVSDFSFSLSESSFLVPKRPIFA